MEFDMLLTATTRDEGGLKASFERQLAEFGGTSELISQVGPYRVESSDGYFFEAQRMYRITL